VEADGAGRGVRGYSLLYHDVVRPGHPDASGFPGGAADRYKLDWPEFERHLDAIAGAVGRPPVRVGELPSSNGGVPWLLTFDDGGASAREVGERLAERGWPAHFFVTVDYLDSPSFVTADDVRALASLGHVIGSHSCSHPDRMASATPAALLDEWSRSTERLSELVDAPVRVASVPAGSYAPHVARAAGAAGISALFTSEPEAQHGRVDGCLVVGRYTMRRSTPPRTAARIAAGARAPRAAQLAAWRAKKVVRRVSGPAYEHTRRRFLG
jgi:peptidoglycan/xylan/chitin deacetylase (PgdA/CDA1 family)